MKKSKNKLSKTYKNKVGKKNKIVKKNKLGKKGLTIKSKSKYLRRKKYTKKRINKHKRKSIKGGGELPFSDITLIPGQINHGISSITSGFSNPATLPNQSAGSNVNPSPTSQFLRTDNSSSNDFTNVSEIFNKHFQNE